MASKRFVGSTRRELLDHVIVLGKDRLRRLVQEDVRYDEDDRPHVALEKEASADRAVEHATSEGAEVVAFPRLGGLCHRYGWEDGEDLREAA